MKCFNIMFNVGKAKYVVNHHDGVKKHKDGSPFFDVSIFSNKRQFNTFLSSLKRQNYVEKTVLN